MRAIYKCSSLLARPWAAPFQAPPRPQRRQPCSQSLRVVSTARPESSHLPLLSVLFSPSFQILSNYFVFTRFYPTFPLFSYSVFSLRLVISRVPRLSPWLTRALSFSLVFFISF